MFMEDENMWGLNYPFSDRKLIGSEKGYSDAYDGRDFRLIISHVNTNNVRCTEKPSRKPQRCLKTSNCFCSVG